jgi:hypothetical protein
LGAGLFGKTINNPVASNSPYYSPKVSPLSKRVATNAAMLLFSFSVMTVPYFPITKMTRQLDTSYHGPESYIPTAVENMMSP